MPTDVSDVSEVPAGRRVGGPRGWVRAGRDRTAREVARLHAARQRHASVDTAFGILDRDTATAGGLLAGALAYRMFLWLLPAALVSYAFFGFSGSNDAQEAADVVGLQDLSTASIQEALAEAQRHRWWALFIGLPLLYLASGHLLKALQAVHTLAWEGTARRRRRSPVGVLVVVGFAVLAAAVPTAGAAIRERGGVPGLLFLITVIAFWTALWWLASHLLPHGEAGALDLLPGAALFAAGIQLMYLATILYFSRKIAAAAELYGTLGAAATLLLWLYLLARLAVAAAVVNAVLWERGTVRQLAGRLLR